MKLCFYFNTKRERALKFLIVFNNLLSSNCHTSALRYGHPHIIGVYNTSYLFR